MCIPLWYRNNKAVTKCLCAAGYQLNDENKCVMKLSPKFLLLAQSKPAVIKGINVFNKYDEMLSITNLKEPHSLDYDIQTNSVIYFDATRKVIEVVSLNNTSNRRLLVDHIYSLGLAVDWIGRNLYYIDGIRRCVKALSLSSATYTKTVISNLHNLPSSLALDPRNGMLYLATWSDVSPMQGRIYSASMNGSNLKLFVNDDVHWPAGLSVNYETNRLYWCDQHKQTVESVDLKGKNRLVEIRENLGQPSALALGNLGELFVVSRSEGVVKVFKNKTLVDTINKTSSDIFDIKLFNPESREGENLKLVVVASCDHLLLQEKMFALQQSVLSFV